MNATHRLVNATFGDPILNERDDILVQKLSGILEQNI